MRHGTNGSVENVGAETPSIVVCSPDIILRHGIRAIGQDACPALQVAETSSIGDAADTALASRAAALVVDAAKCARDVIAELPRLRGRVDVILLVHRRDTLLQQAMLEHREVRILVQQELTDAQLRSALAACGVVSSDAATSRTRAKGLPTSRRTVRNQTHPHPANLAGRTLLTPREIEVMNLVAQGLRNGEIAQTLGMSEKTVKNHLNRIFAKFNVDTRERAILIWLNT
jgi:DNA-binding NarL/FixJ family response regulator